jgi:hypothetical protein
MGSNSKKGKLSDNLLSPITKSEFMKKMGLHHDNFPAPGQTFEIIREPWSLKDYFKHMAHMPVKKAIAYMACSKDGSAIEVAVGQVKYQGTDPLLNLIVGDMLQKDLHGIAFEASVEGNNISRIRPSSVTKIVRAPELFHLNRYTDGNLKSWDGNFYPTYSSDFNEATAIDLVTRAVKKLRQTLEEPQFGPGR